jgi:hypothetical protein
MLNSRQCGIKRTPRQAAGSRFSSEASELKAVVRSLTPATAGVRDDTAHGTVTVLWLLDKTNLICHPDESASSLGTLRCLIRGIAV